MEKSKIQDGAYGNFVTGMGHAQMDKGESTFAKPYGGSDLYELAKMKV